MSDSPNTEELIEILRYPTSIIRKEIDLSQCTDPGVFQRENEKCITCYHTPECEWLLFDDDSKSGERLESKQLLAALQFAADYMHAHLTLKRHAPLECPCEACSWWRSAKATLDGFIDEPTSSV